MGLAGVHRDTEAALAASGLPVALLRNGWHTENHTGTLRDAVARGAPEHPTGDLRALLGRPTETLAARGRPRAQGVAGGAVSPAGSAAASAGPCRSAP